MATERIAPSETKGSKRLSFIRMAQQLADLAAEKRLYDLLNALPTATYTTDAEGRITFYNEAAAAFWGVRPALHKVRWCGSLRLFWPDGRPLPHDECPMAVALRERRSVNGQEAVLERPDGTRISFMAFPSPLCGANGEVIGAVNMLIDISERRQVEQLSQRLAAIVESSDDAIVSKDVNGVVVTWNRGAERLFGYSPSEIVGKPISILMPPDRENEEPEILARIRRGERIDHYETVRRRKDGSLVEISLSVSPLLSKEGAVIGVSKIARDISERKRAEERINLLVHEVQHRAKNLLALAQAAVHLSHADSVEELKKIIDGRLQALAGVHNLIMEDGAGVAVDFRLLVESQIAPFAKEARATIAGPSLMIGPRLAQAIAVTVHELTTNAVKYGSLSHEHGHVRVEWKPDATGDILFIWQETGTAIRSPTRHGFGTVVVRKMIGALGGKVEFHWRESGMECRISLPRAALSEGPPPIETAPFSRPFRPHAD